MKFKRVDSNKQDTIILLHFKLLTCSNAIIQGGAKLMELSLVTHVPSGPIGCALAGHFAWQK